MSRGHAPLDAADDLHGRPDTPVQEMNPPRGRRAPTVRSSNVQRLAGPTREEPVLVFFEPGVELLLALGACSPSAGVSCFLE